MSWMHQIYVDTYLYIGIRWVIFNIKVNNVFIFLLFYNFVFKELPCSLRFSCNWRSCVSLSLGVSNFYKNVTVLSVVYYYDWNTACHKNVITIHQCISDTRWYKVIILPLFCYQCMNHYIGLTKEFIQDFHNIWKNLNKLFVQPNICK